MNNANKKSKRININIIPINNVVNCKNYKANNKNSKSRINFKQSLEKIKNDKSEYKYESLRTKNVDKEDNITSMNLNDYELNTLIYAKAIKYDKRTYFQYYISSVKKKQLILFAFMPTNDYNLTTIKISIFILTFSLYFTVNGLFFTDSTMHRVYIDNGSYNLLYQIPQMIYSTLISSVIKTTLRLLSLSEENILKIKSEKSSEITTKKIRSIRTCIAIKFTIFFILSIFLLLFFWYFISCFCGVYTNTQIILIKDILISFGMSMIYPFGLSLIPGIFRISALRDQKHDKKCLYQFSNLLSIIF